MVGVVGQQASSLVAFGGINFTTQPQLTQMTEINGKPRE
jgi:hypothetical protein